MPVDQLSFVDIATLVDASVNTVKSRYRYAIDKLRTSLKIKDYENYEEFITNK